MSRKHRGQIWSAAPTPLDDNLRLDVPSIGKLVEHHVQLGIDGMLLLGNMGEGPYVLDADKERLVREAVQAAAGAIQISVQVTDNSALRILENIDRARKNGAQVAVMAEPYFLRNPTPENILRLYAEVLSRSSLPIGLYHLATRGPLLIDEETLATIYGLPGIAMIKDSSSDPRRRKIALDAKARRPELQLLNGDEYLCRDYVEAGYDGALFGGAVFNALHVADIFASVETGDLVRAAAVDEWIRQLNATVYGPNWENLTAGEKYLLTRLGVLKGWQNFPNYPLDDMRKQAIDDLVSGGRLFKRWEQA